MSKTKKALIIALFYGIGIVCVFAICFRAKQIDNNSNYNNHSYYDYEMSNK